MKETKTALVIGATGLVGKELVKQLLEDKSFAKVCLLLRRTTGLTHPKLEEHIVNFDEPDSYRSLLQGDVLFSCMGTTLAKAGSKKAQYKVDFTYQHEAAKIAAENSVSNYVLVSASNANAKSPIFYSRIKGELDVAVMKLSFESCLIFRPGILMGQREEKRGGEETAAKIINVLGKFIPPLKKYRGIKGEEVAKAMILAHKNSESHKKRFYTLDEIFNLIY